MIKRFLIAIILTGLVAAGIVGFNMFRDQAIQDFFANRQVPPLPVDTVVAEAGEWLPGIEAIGTIYAARGIDVAIEAGGVIRDVNFSANERVEAGQQLVQVDDTIERAELAAAEAQVRVSEQALTRAQTLSSRGVSTTSSVEEAQANATSAQAQIQRLQAVLSQKALEAPFSGTMGIPQVDIGQYTQPGTIVATLQDLDDLRVDFYVPEQSFGALSIGQAVSVGTEEARGAASGHITGIEPRIDPRTRLVRVRARIENVTGLLSPGQFAQVRVQLEREDNVVALPQTAVVTSLYGDYVYLVEPAEAGEDDAEQRFVARQAFVQTGRRSGGRVEIVEGVEPGAHVVVTGQNRISNGAAVAPAAQVDTTGDAADAQTGDEVTE